MFLEGTRLNSSGERLPRAGGGVSYKGEDMTITNASSPRRRGCFRTDLSPVYLEIVFPAQAGVFLIIGDRVPPIYCLPRAGGGVSIVSSKQSVSLASSPRRRGCFPLLIPPLFINHVFPAQAGVFPSSCFIEGPKRRLPRAGGGVSIHYTTLLGGIQSSPRRRGCF